VTLDTASTPAAGRITAALAARFLSVLVLLALWEIAARLVASRLFPAASAVLAALAEEVLHGALPANLALTLLRVAAAFAISMVLGTALGLAMGYWRRLDLVLDSWLTALLNMPALVIIMLAYVWFGLNEAAAVAAVAINKLPATAITIREGARALDRGLLEMAASFRLSKWVKFRQIILPQLIPYLFAAARSGLSLIWKIVLVVELLGRSNGVGFQIELYFQLFDVTRILAYTIAFIGVVQLIEWGLLQPLERRMTRWRQ
jgi:NitT/TauT family transport system permease protein